MFVIKSTFTEPDPLMMWHFDTGLYCRCADISSSNSREVYWEIQSFGTRKVSLNLYEAKTLF